MRIALYPGTFDPMTNGHLDVVRRAAALVDRLVVAIGIRPGKTPLFPIEERVEMVQAVIAPVAAQIGCEMDCITYDDLVVTAARRVHASILIRGLRNGSDLDDEMQMADMNETMTPDLKTVFLPTSSMMRPIKATLVRQIAGMGGDVSHFVPTIVASGLKVRFAK
ncbi:pantetheine-phosphate adenylyltransferase [Bradyrhizobium sp. McL0616]|uniref:pantetheine-phosphate adenylyltransferase n=1 Tax=Bradyrhizobium sp. McL0616 TaxID=3415674 RepID=UPI003CED5757